MKREYEFDNTLSLTIGQNASNSYTNYPKHFQSRLGGWYDENIQDI